MDEIYSKAEKKNGSFDKEAWAEKKKKQRQAVYDLLDEVTVRMKTDDHAFKQYLMTQAVFDRYSVTNAILVSAQMPGASQLKSRDAWKEAGLYLLKNAQGILILEPGNVYTKEDGSEAQGFDLKTVYDVSQTNLRFQDEPDGQELSLRSLLLALMDTSRAPFEVVDESLPVRVLFDPDKNKILIAKQQPEEILFVGIARELAISIFYHRYGLSRESCEFAGSCIPIMLLARYADASEFPMPELPESFGVTETQSFRRELKTIRDVYAEMIREVERELNKKEEPDL